jgi:hypothetical protein
MGRRAPPARLTVSSSAVSFTKPPDRTNYCITTCLMYTGARAPTSPCAQAGEMVVGVLILLLHCLIIAGFLAILLYNILPTFKRKATKWMIRLGLEPSRIREGFDGALPRALTRLFTRGAGGGRGPGGEGDGGAWRKWRGWSLSSKSSFSGLWRNRRSRNSKNGPQQQQQQQEEQR